MTLKVTWRGILLIRHTIEETQLGHLVVCRGSPLGENILSADKRNLAITTICFVNAHICLMSNHPYAHPQPTEQGTQG